MDFTPEERHGLESDLTWRRIRELRLNPIKGSFDAAHLKAIHRYIFQDLPKAGLNHIPPGSFREESSTGKWLKNRQLTTKPIMYQVAYSSMDKASVMTLDNVMKGAKPEEFSGLDLKAFNQKMGKLYADLDFIHPFVEGNSRTLREFTRQLAKESGFDVNWDRFNKNDAGRDILYIARDLSVIERALNHIKDEDLLHSINVSQFRIKDNRKLPDLIKDVVRPSPPTLTVYAGSIQSGKSAIAAVNGQTPQKLAHDGLMVGIEQKRSICVETALTPDMLKAMNEAKKNGYEVNLHYAHNYLQSLGFMRARDAGLQEAKAAVPEFLRDIKENYRNLESGIALSARAKIYDCSEKAPVMTHDFSKGKLLSGGGFTAPEGIKECSLAENMKIGGSGFEAKVSPDIDLKLSESGMKLKM